jgi:transcriptional regulator with XRE-family HTH domain
MKYLYSMRTAKKEKSIFNRQVIKLRTARGLTQEQLSSALGVSRNTIAYYEARAVNPGTELIQKIAEFFNVRPGTLIGDDEKKKTSPGPSSRLEKQLKLIQELPPSEKKAVSMILDMALRNVHKASLL